jgi:RNA polymerase II subunit A-like phosphatase
VHRAFFEQYDKTKEVTNVSAIVSYMRKQVLKNEVICLSGIVPIGYPKSRSLVYRLCVQFGATVVDEIDEKTTVLIAARPSTEKVRMAIKKNIPVVTEDWILTAAAKWLNLPKSDFGHHGLDLKHFRERREAGNQSPKLSDLEPLSKEEMKSMTDEIDAELGETSSSESENDAAEDDEKGSDTEGEIEDQSIAEIKKHVEEPVSEGDREENKILLAKLKAGEGDTDDEEIDERYRNGDIDSRKRRRRSDSTELDNEPAKKRFSADDVEEGDDNDDDDDSDDEMVAAIESQIGRDHNE